MQPMWPTGVGRATDTDGTGHMLYFTSDTHFGDPRVLRIDRRPFATVAAHDAALIENWNAVVGADDEIWHLGDFARGDAQRVGALLAGLNGRKHLVIGNNDGDAAIAAPGWASVQHYAELRLDGRLVVLCHYPFRTWNQMGKGALDLHGHSHGRLRSMPRQYDVGVDAQGLRPVTVADAVARPRRAAALFGASAVVPATISQQGEHRMAQYDRLIAFLEHEAEFLRGRIATLESTGWPLPRSPGEDEGGPDTVETQIAGYKAKLEEIESHIADLRRPQQ